MIKVKNLTLAFGEKSLYNNANFDIPDNKVTVISGTNGVGKTTLLKIMSGQIKVPNAVIENSFKEIFFLPQNIRYPEGITLFEYITSSFFKNSFKWFLNEEEKRKAERVIEELELSDRRDVLIEKLSSGELQKANIAMALASDADCLFLDEPTSNMDLINQIKIMNIIKNLTKRGITVVIIMHDLNMASSYGDYFIGFNNKNDIIKAEKNKFFTEENLEKIFGIKFKVVKYDKDFHIQIFN